MDTVIIAMSIGLGITLLIGIYRLATRRFREDSAFRTDSSTNSRQALQTVLTIFFTILVFLAIYVTWTIFAK